jgi:hypothetical protein
MLLLMLLAGSVTSKTNAAGLATLHGENMYQICSEKGQRREERRGEALTLRGKRERERDGEKETSGAEKRGETMMKGDGRKERKGKEKKGSKRGDMRGELISTSELANVKHISPSV